MGSSPHTRGALEVKGLEGVAVGIIPAYAGSTESCSLSVDSARDHPRIRGEHLLRLRISTLTSGSSPHTRGARSIPRARKTCAGIIPAYAGSTLKNVDHGGLNGDHPRIRGEHLATLEVARSKSGSSPHTRGALRIRFIVAKNGGIIPAYAGSTRF